MNDSPVNQSNMLEKTDCCEAVDVFRGWKNFFFLVVLLCLLLVQAAFWLVDLGFIEIDKDASALSAVAPEPYAGAVVPAADSAVADANAALQPAPAKDLFGTGLLAGFTFDHLTRTVELANGILIVAASLYCLAMFFSLMVSLIGRLGGINHISRSFFLSLIMLMLVIPWQKLLSSSVMGVVYMPAELVRWFSGKDGTLVNMILYYLRFSGYWLVVMLLLLMSQMRSGRWTKAILRRLEII